MLIKSTFLFLDPINHANEYSRDVYFNSLNFFNFTVIKSFLKSYEDVINLNLITNYLFYYFFNNNSALFLESKIFPELKSSTQFLNSN